jgi:hypothetical protein
MAWDDCSRLAVVGRCVDRPHDEGIAARRSRSWSCRHRACPSAAQRVAWPLRATVADQATWVACK